MQQTQQQQQQTQQQRRNKITDEETITTLHSSKLFDNLSRYLQGLGISVEPFEATTGLVPFFTKFANQSRKNNTTTPREKRSITMSAEIFNNLDVPKDVAKVFSTVDVIGSTPEYATNLKLHVINDQFARFLREGNFGNLGHLFCAGTSVPFTYENAARQDGWKRHCKDFGEKKVVDAVNAKYGVRFTAAQWAAACDINTLLDRTAKHNIASNNVQISSLTAYNRINNERLRDRSVPDNFMREVLSDMRVIIKGEDYTDRMLKASESSDKKKEHLQSALDDVDLFSYLERMPVKDQPFFIPDDGSDSHGISRQSIMVINSLHTVSPGKNSSIYRDVLPAYLANTESSDENDFFSYNVWLHSVLKQHSQGVSSLQGTQQRK